MGNPSSFLFYCDGNPHVGRGHISRCVSLARHLKMLYPRTRISFCGQFDEFSLATLRRNAFSSKPSPGPIGSRIIALAKTAERFSTLILDNYHLKQEHIDYLSEFKFKLIAFDDFRRLDLRRANLVINFTCGAEKRRYGVVRCALGLRYFPAKPELRAIRARNTRQPRKKVREVLVALTGTSTRPALLPTILHSLDSILVGSRIRYVSERGVAEEFGGHNQLEHIVPHPGIESRFARTDLIVSGGGMLRYESGYCRIPNVSISLNEGQRRDTSRLRAIKTTFDLGCADRIDSASLRRRLIAFLDDPRARLRQWSACRSAFDAISGQRLARFVYSS